MVLGGWTELQAPLCRLAAPRCRLSHAQNTPLSAPRWSCFQPYRRAGPL